MATVKFCLVTCIVATWAMAAANGGRFQQSDLTVLPPTLAPAAAAPGVDCTSLIYNMIDCVSFLSAGSNETAPDPSCCSGFKTVLETDAGCICEGLKSSADLGIEIDMTKAATLPSSCGISAPSLSDCQISSAPGAPPANPPPSAPEPATDGGGGEVNLAPAPSPNRAHAISYSSAVHFSMVVVSFFYILA